MRSFKIYGILPQTDIHTTSANTVTLAWGSLRLAPTIPKHNKATETSPKKFSEGKQAHVARLKNQPN